MARGKSLPRVSNGHPTSFTKVIAPQGRATAIPITSLETGATHAVPFWIQGATAVRIEAASLTADRRRVIVVGAFTRKTDARARLVAFGRSPGGTIGSAADKRRLGRAEPDVRNFAADVDVNGRVISVLDLGDYTAERVCGAPDGPFWTFGQVWPNEFKRGRKPDVPLLRQYKDGKVAGEYLDRSRLGKLTAANYHAGTRNSAVAHLSCGNDTVVVYAERSPEGSGFLWTEVFTPTGDVREVRVHHPAGLRITGLTVVGRHEAYASFAPAQANGDAAPGSIVCPSRPKKRGGSGCGPIRAATASRC